MNSNTDLKNLWQQQSAYMPDPSTVKRSIMEFTKKQRRKKILFNITMFGTASYLAVMGWWLMPHSALSNLGIIIMVAIIVTFIWYYNRQQNILNYLDINSSNRDYLNKLIRFRRQQHFVQTKVLSYYFIFLLAGLSLALYPVLKQLPEVWQLFVYGTTLLWIAFVWFYIRPAKIKRQTAQLESLIGNLETIVKQMDE